MTDNLFDLTPLETMEIVDHCCALAYAMTELTHPVARDTLLWVLVEKLVLLNFALSAEESGGGEVGDD